MSMPENEPIIKVNQLRAQFGDNVVLDKVSFSVARGEVVVIAGGSGCGKSTLLKHIIGLYDPALGSIILDGIEITTADEKQMKHVRRQIGVLFQSGALLGSLTLLENVMLPLLDHTTLSREAAKRLAKLKLALVNLSGYENHLPSEISGGMMKRAGLARAMALDPKVLFFDEPSAGLDPITSAELDRLINDLNQSLGTTMVIVSHELASIFEIAHRVVLLDKSVKGIVAMGPPRKLKDESTDSRVRDFFLRRAGQPGE